MSLEELPFSGLQCACPCRSLCAGSGTNVCVEERQRRELDFVRSMNLVRIEGWIIPFQYRRRISRSIDDNYSQVMCVESGRGGCVLGGRDGCRKQADGRAQNECVAVFRSGRSQLLVSIVIRLTMVLESEMMKEMKYRWNCEPSTDAWALPNRWRQGAEQVHQGKTWGKD